MAYRATRKTRRRPRKTAGRRMMKKRWQKRSSTSARSAMTTVYNYNRWQTPQYLTINAGSNEYVFGALTYQLSDLNGTDLANYKALFDFYRMNGVMVRFRLRANPDAYSRLNVTTGPAAMNFYPEIHFCVDHNDANAAGSVEEFLQMGPKVKTCILKPNTWVWYKFHPTIQQLIFSGLSSAYSIPGSKNPFINCTNDGAPHYGLKYAIGMPGLGSFTQDCYLEVQYKYHITFKGNR